jgi:hypothetical protein
MLYSQDGGETWDMFNELYGSASGAGLVMEPDIEYIPSTNEIIYSAIDPTDEYSACFGWMDGDVTAPTTKFGACWGFGAEATYQALSYLGPWAFRFIIGPDGDPDTPHLVEMRYDAANGYAYPQDDGYGAFGSYYDGMSMLQTAPAKYPAMAAGSERMYMVFQVDLPEPDGGTQIGFKATHADLDPASPTFIYTGDQVNACDKYADIEVWPWQQYLVGEDPDVAAEGLNLCIVYSHEGKVKCHYTSTHPTAEHTNQPEYTFSNTVIDDGAYPAVHMRGGKTYCAYVKNGNCYQTISEDGGATWSAPTQLNEVDGTVVAEEGSIAVIDLGTVWTDNRNGAKDLYIAAGGGGDIAVVEIKSIAGGVGVTAEVTNTGTAAATDVAWTIDLEGNLVFLGGHAEGVISNLAPGDTVQIKSGFPLGFGPINIKVTAGEASKTASGTLLLFFITGL